MNNEVQTFANTLDATICPEESSVCEMVVKIDPEMGRDNYSVQEEGGKLYFSGGHDYSALAAVRQASTMISSAKENDTILQIPSGYRKDGFCDKSVVDDLYTLTWSEEFDGSSVNWKVWNTENTTSAGVNDKYAKAVPDNVSVSDGTLKIKCSYDDQSYYGGQVNSCGYLSYKYGYVEAKMYIPQEAGFWPSFWARGLNTTSGLDSFRFLEVDFFERFGKLFDPGTLKSSVLQWDYNAASSQSLSGGQLYYGSDTGKLSSLVYNPDNTWTSGVGAGWHTIGCDWTDTYMSFICDGTIFYKFDYSKDNDRVKQLMTSENLYLIFGMGAGYRSDMIDAPDATTDWNQSFKVDWVHIYQKSGSNLSVKYK